MREDRLTIRVSGREEFIPFGSFLSVAQNTLKILQGIDRTFSEDSNASVKWRIETVSMNSPLTLTIFGETIDDNEDISHDVIDAYTNGIRELESGTHTVPPHFTVATLKTLKEMTTVLNDGIAAITVFSDNERPVNPTQRIMAVVDELIGPEEFEEYTTLEGELKMISVKGGRQFNIYDTLRENKIECHFPQSMVDKAAGAFDKRVAVTGKARYKRDGTPFSMQVEENGIFVFPDQKDLPQFSDLEKFNVIGDVGAFDYLGGNTNGD